jgi:adenosine deaminase CECR1
MSMTRMTLIVLLLSCAAPAFSTARDAEAPETSAARFEIIKQEAAPEELYRLLYAMPKGGDLHNHLGGSNRAEWWYRLAVDQAQNGGYRYYTKTAIRNCSTAMARPVDSGREGGRRPRPYLLYFTTIQASTFDALDDCQQREYTPLEALDADTRQAWLDSLRLETAGEGRDEFFERTWNRIGELLRNPYINVELLVENMKRYGAEGLRYLETQTGATGFIDPEGKQLAVEEVVALYRERLRQPDARATGVEVRFQLTVLRFAADAEEQVREAFAFVDSHRDLWVAVNMAGREDDDRGHPERFRDVFAEMRRRYPRVHLSIHAGETDRPSRHVRETLLLGAERIGHGIDVIKDDDTILLLRKGPWMLENNLVSNQLLEYTPDLSLHPFPQFLRLGIPVGLNTDDRGMWDSNMSDEYYIAVTEFNLSWEELVQVGRNSLVHAFLEEPVKARLLADYDAAILAFERRFLTDGWRSGLSGVDAESYGYARRHFGISFD